MGDRLRQARAGSRPEPARPGRGRRRLAEPHLAGRDGRAKPSVNTLYALATELGISLDILLFMDTQPPAATATPAR